MPARPFKRTWTGSKGRKSPICGKWLSRWREATEIGVRRFVVSLRPPTTTFTQWLINIVLTDVHGTLLDDQNLEAWQDAKQEIAKIPDHPNQLPKDITENDPASAGPSMTRRDSTATINGR